MPDLSGIPALDVVIGLAFVYFLLSIVCSAVTEALSGVLGWRAKDLRKGLRKLLVDDSSLATFLDGARVQALFKDQSWLVKRWNAPAVQWFLGGRPPSYIPPRVFALTFLDTVAPPADGVESQDLLARAKAAVERAELPDGVAKLLQDALEEGRGRVDAFRGALERAFDEVMDRVSGWYKRRAQIAVLVIALAVAGAANVDSFAVGERLWKDDAVRAAVVAQAQAETDPATCRAAQEETDALDRAAACLGQVDELDLPIGWSEATTPDSTAQSLGKALGLLITAFALSLGAPFWFDALGKLARLRATGNRSGTAKDPARSAEDRDDPSRRGR